MKRNVTLLAIFILILSSCTGQGGMVESRGSVEPPDSRSPSFAAEWPDPTQPLPIDGADVPSSAAPLPSSSQEPSSSDVPSSSVAPSSSAAPSSSTAPVSSVAPSSSVPAAAVSNTATVPDEVAAIWISYLDFYTLAQNRSQAQFTRNIDAAFADIADYGLNTVFVQVRPFGDAMYRSEIFPWSYVMTKTEGVDPGYDPLGIMVSTAQKHGLRIEAWINPYRVRPIGTNRELSGDNPAVLALEAGEDTAIEFNGGIFYNPASKSARDLITRGVVELIENYDIDGVHFDDYFYPTTDLSFDAGYYNLYRAGGGGLSQADWRRQNVNLLIKQVYSAIKNADSGVLFGISPQARMDNNYDGQFIDVQVWLKNSGYIDYICPQIYYGFNNETVPYATSLAQWNDMVKGTGVDLYVGMAVYKCGTVDNWAGQGKNEWISSTDLISRMVTAARRSSEYAGFVLYRYDSLFCPEAAVSAHISAERDNLAAVL